MWAISVEMVVVASETEDMDTLDSNVGQKTITRDLTRLEKD